ncbi:hypothetical protein L6164_036787 [Bauhinia variegata]|uniref:Uncharacterized protein n=1 Tax=Bauhinia variegata TaxID=167791 RepID=A0ACB9KI69_BAUVA|nr:hypothetical protein L6164_036787 [Bauhinia variegata]
MGSNRVEPGVPQRIQALLQHFRSPLPANGGNNSSQNQFKPTKRAAVLVCLFEGDDGNLRVILTKRASSLSTHSGEVALPGGKREEGDANDVETALREAKEEIGLDPSLVTVITLLEPFTTKYNMTVFPVVGVLSNKDAFIPVLNSAEVEAIFDAPLEMFLKNENRRAEEKDWMGEKYLVHYFEYEVENKKYLIWALTAAILIRAASVICQQRPEFLERRPKIWGGITENDMILLRHCSKQ